MKHKLQVLLVIIIVLIALVIAVPTIAFSFRGKNYEISNLNPTDLNLDLIQDAFSYKPALDLQGGYTVIFDINLDNYPEDKLDQFRKTEGIIARRMALIGLKDFEFTSFYNPENDVFQLHLTTPEELDESLIQVLTSPGVLDVLVDETEAPLVEETENTSILDGRKSAGISNADIQSAKVVSDSRIYTNDPETPNNFGLEVVFQPESKQKLQMALLSNISTNTPLIFTLDGSFVALQASGLQLNPYQENDTILLYTLLVDSKLNNAVIGAVMSSPNIDIPVTVNATERLLPMFGEDTLINLKLISLAAVGVLSFVLVGLFGKRSIYLLVSAFVYLVLNIAFQKVLNLNLSLSLIIATQLMLVLFVSSQAFLVLQSQKYKTKLLEEFIEQNTLKGWKAIFSFILIIPMILYFENLLTASINQFIQVLILGLIIWLVYKIIFFKTLFKIFVKPSGSE